MKSKLHISGIECYAYHGCLPEETKIGCNFRVDVSFEMDFAYAVQKDDLSQTIDYVTVHKVVRDEMAVPSKLIEHVCGRIARSLVGLLIGPGSVSVTIIKFNPPVNGKIEEAAFTIELTHNQ